MKKVLHFFRSMRFGILLLILIALCSVAGSLIPQDKAISWYAQNYGTAHGLILMLRLHRIFESLYFVLLLVLLCLNLIFCSLVRIVGVVKDRQRIAERTARMKAQVLLNGEGTNKLKQYLEDMHCRAEHFGDVQVYRKNDLGRYGSFIIHLSILLIVVFGAGALYLPVVTDRSCFPGESIHLEDGTEIAVSSFHIEDATGRLDYSSQIQVRLPNGRASEWADIRVNHPFSFGSYKIYQQTYGTAGCLTVTNLDTGGSDDFLLNDTALLSLDGTNGIWYEAVYPGYVVDSAGKMTLITSTSGRYEDPIYEVLVSEDGSLSPMLLFPGEELEAGGMRFHFNDPVEYPGLRIKHTPTIVNVLLIAAFVLLILGLYFTFFLPPILVKVDEHGYAVGGPKPEGIRIELEELLHDCRMEEQQ